MRVTEGERVQRKKEQTHQMHGKPWSVTSRVLFSLTVSSGGTVVTPVTGRSFFGTAAYCILTSCHFALGTSLLWAVNHCTSYCPIYQSISMKEDLKFAIKFHHWRVRCVDSSQSLMHVVMLELFSVTKEQGEAKGPG